MLEKPVTQSLVKYSTENINKNKNRNNNRSVIQIQSQI